MSTTPTNKDELDTILQQVTDFMEAQGFEFIDRQKHYPTAFRGYWVKDGGKLSQCSLDNDAAAFMYRQTLIARRDELDWLGKNASGGGNWRRLINLRVAAIDQLVKESGE